MRQPNARRYFRPFYGSSGGVWDEGKGGEENERKARPDEDEKRGGGEGGETNLRKKPTVAFISGSTSSRFDSISNLLSSSFSVPYLRTTFSFFLPLQSVLSLHVRAVPYLAFLSHTPASEDSTASSPLSLHGF